MSALHPVISFVFPEVRWPEFSLAQTNFVYSDDYRKKII